MLLGSGKAEFCSVASPSSFTASTNTDQTEREDTSDSAALLQGHLLIKGANAMQSTDAVFKPGRTRSSEEPEISETYLPGDIAVMQSASLLQQLKVVLSDDEQRATVSFTTKGQSKKYEMDAVSCYDSNANISVWTGTAWEYIHPGKPRTFRSRAEKGYARARIHEDGSVSGLFEQEDGRVVDVRPLHPDDKDDPAYSLLAQHQGGGHAHVFEYTGPLDLESSPYASLVHQHATSGKPFVYPASTETKFMPGGDPTPPKTPTVSEMATWGGSKVVPWVLSWG